MATLTAPGVYVEEISSGVRPIAAAGTSTAAFFGEAERGTIGEVAKIFHFTEFQTRYGNYLDGGRYLAHGVYQFFNNGGSACYVGRVAPGAQTAGVTVLDRDTVAQDSLTVEASSPGTWGNQVMVIIDSTTASDPDNLFNLTIFQDDPDPDEAPIELESYTDLSMDPGASNFVENVVNGRSIYIQVAINEANSNQINGYSESAEVDEDGAAMIGAAQRQFRINLNGDGFRTVDLTDEIAANSPDLADAAAVALTIQNEIQSLTPSRESTDVAVYNAATVTFTQTTAPAGVFRITAGGTAAASSSVLIQNAQDPLVNVAGALGLGPRNGGTEVYGSANMRPQSTPADDFYLLGDDTVAGAVSAVDLGTNGATPQDQDYIEALNWLDTIRDVSLVAVPGEGSEALIDAGMNYCANRHLSDCFFIGDVGVDDDDYDAAITFRDTLNNPNSYGAVYFPWILTLDPTGVSAEPIAVPPSGFMAGIYSRTDARRGVWKAPAGTEAIVSGAVGLETELTDVQQGDLNNDPKSISVIRRFPSSGIVVWGARAVSSDAEYKYISVRRTAIMLRVSIFNGIQWAVFEPNDDPLWSSLRLNIGSFMNTLFRRGAFQGATASDAYFVKCDSETTTQADIDLGIVNVLVGFAPLKPAEFVVVKIQQIAGQAP